MKSTYNFICKAMLLFMCIFFLSGCSSPRTDSKDNKKVVSDEQRVLTVGADDVAIDEVMLYLLRAKKEYERVGGEDVWDHDDFSGGKKAEEWAKQVVLNSITKRKIYAAKSSEIGISLTEEEITDAKNQGNKYYDSLTGEETSQYGLTREAVTRAFLESKLGTKVETVMMEEYEPPVEEVNMALEANENYKRLRDADKKQILRKLKVKRIIFRTHEKNDKDEYVLLSEGIIDEAKKDAKEAHDRIANGADFVKVMAQYNPDSTHEEQLLSVSVMPESFKSLSELEVGQVSEVLQNEEGFHLFKLIEFVEPTEQEIEDYTVRFDQWVELLREQAIKDIKKGVVEETYTDWKNNTDIMINEALWEKIDVFGNINKNTN